MCKQLETATHAIKAIQNHKARHFNDLKKRVRRRLPHLISETNPGPDG
jgi:hypothetical protein